jgi:soluble lytic murein transglycosylase-like protein
MKRSIAVLHKRGKHRVQLVRLLPPVLSLYLILFGLLPLRDAPSEAERANVGAETSPPQALDLDVTRVALVAKMIESESPSHPNKHSLANIIVSESRKQDVDPLFVAAIVRAESMFKHKAVSRRGAQGLMQIMPATGRFIAKNSNIALKDTEALHNPETNIKLGVWYVRYLLTKFKGNRAQMLAAYNWGPSNMLKAIASGASLPKESLQYVNKVLSHHTMWTERLSQFAALPRDSSIG